MKMIKSLIAGAALLAGSTAANATLYQIQMSGLDLNYNQAAGTFCDNGGGIGCNTAADSLVTMTFLADGVLQGIYTTNIALNLLIYLPAGTNPATNGTTNIVNTPSGVGGDVFDAQINGAPGLFTDVTTGSVTFSNGSVNATGTGFSTVFAQNLPFGFVAGNPINWSFSSGLGSCAAGVCTYAGTGELSWTTRNVPEPTSAALVLLTGLGLVVTARRRRNKA